MHILLEEAIDGRGIDCPPSLSAEELFKEFCEWHGIINWAPTLLKVWAECQEVTNGTLQGNN